MNFIPDTPKKVKEVPYYEDVSSKDGWQGQQTTKSMERLKQEVTDAVERLGGVVRSFQSGTFMMGGDEARRLPDYLPAGRG